MFLLISLIKIDKWEIKGLRLRNFSRIFWIKTVFIISFFLLTILSSCSESTHPEVVSILPTYKDQVHPNFRIRYRRVETSSSNGLIEGINMTLYHSVNGNLIDYGNVAFGGVDLWINGNVYYGYIQTGLPNNPFSEKFRFDKENLSFTSENSSVLEDINTELKIEPVVYLVNLVQGQVVNLNENLLLEFNRDIKSASLDLLAYGGIKHVLVEFEWPSLTRTMILAADSLKAVMEQSDSDSFFLHLSVNLDSNNFVVKAKDSDQSITVFVYCKSVHSIELNIQ